MSGDYPRDARTPNLLQGLRRSGPPELSVFRNLPTLHALQRKSAAESFQEGLKERRHRDERSGPARPVGQARAG